jgi:hypothetical protein
MLEKNIRRGNSLLNGSPEEVAETLDISVDDAKDLGAFDWKENFDQIFSDDGFDIVVGNPPLGEQIQSLTLNGLRIITNLLPGNMIRTSYLLNSLENY